MPVMGAASSSAYTLYRLAKMSPFTLELVFLAFLNLFATPLTVSGGNSRSYVVGRVDKSSGSYS